MLCKMLTCNMFNRMIRTMVKRCEVRKSYEENLKLIEFDELGLMKTK